MDKIEFYTPKNLILKKYIKGYYFYRENNYTVPLNYNVFPSNSYFLTILKRGEAKLVENKMMMLPTVKNKITMSLATHFDHPLQFCYEKQIDEITIIFKPLGINHFVGNSDINLSENFIFEMFFSDIQTEMDKVFRCKNIVKQIDLIENYWLLKLRIPNLKLSPSILKNVENLSIQEVAQRYKMSRQNLHKLFLKEIGKPPSEFKNVNRFRNVLYNRNKHQNLTETAHQNSYYDQAHFIRNFKKYTGITPSHFFKDKNLHKEKEFLFI